MNYFTSKTAAERYARGRPYIHGMAIEMFVKFAGIKKNFQRCLDVACGTGQSTIAAAEICNQVIGIDISENMLSQAAKHPKISYILGVAENLPFKDNSFDIITVGLALHWFDQPAFLKEAYRVLMPHGWLVNYHNEFNRGVPELPEFKEWYESDYLEKYPNPPRKNQLGFKEELAGDLFVVEGKAEYVNELSLTQHELIAYIISQSNVIAAVEQGGEKIDDVISWLTKNTNQFFAQQKKRVFLFDGKIWYLRRR